MNSNPAPRMDSANRTGCAPASSTPDRSAEETLRLIAGLPAPEGLEARVKEALRTAPPAGRVLAWPARIRAGIAPGGHWRRAAAAAAIVFAVVGGGWGVLNRAGRSAAGQAAAAPAQLPAAGGFSAAGAVRTPQTLPGPAVKQPAQKVVTKKKTQKKPAARSTTSHAPLQPAAARE